ncbi:STAS domain-containing protein [Candidatus Peregrinibacteria bacterium]|nr:STAS domain-containing protein [Candidatus Peregrinibacteria bacterium]
MAQIIITVEDIPSAAADKKMKLVKFAGQLDESNVDEKAKGIYDLINATPQGLALIFDFEKLEYMNSKSIGYLTDWYTKLSEKKGGIIIASARPNILDILQVVGLTQLIKCVSSVEEAKAAAMQ